MLEPRLTIGIPTLNRPELLERAIASAMNQATPAKIVIADQGHSPETAHVVSRFLATDKAPLIRHVLTDATNVWENWQAAAKACDTEFFAWLQDDDIVGPNYARRIISQFDAFPQAPCWIARLATATAPDRAIWYAPNGPMVPTDLLNCRSALVEGRLFPPLCYITSFAMSPAVAFRTGEAFNTALARCPANCDLFTERMILAAIGLHGPIICDPALVGLWIQHGDNESKRQRKEQESQVKTLVEWTDAAMREVPDWRPYFESWANVMTPQFLTGFIGELSTPLYAASEFAPQVREVVSQALLGQATIIPPPPDTLKAMGLDILKTLLDLGVRALKVAKRWKALRKRVAR